MIQTIVMTSDRNSKVIPGFCYLWEKYCTFESQVVVVGFSKPELPSNFRFVSQGKQEDFPPKRWSFRLNNVLEEIADEVFILLLDDYWLARQTDGRGIRMIYDYMFQFRNVIRFDLGFDRLYINAGADFNYGGNDYSKLGHLDLIKSPPASPYHLSLWGGMWRRDLLQRFLAPDESAQEIELNGTNRLAEYGDQFLVLGTRQSPLRHVNALQAWEWNYHEISGIYGLEKNDRKELNDKFGYELPL